MAAPPSDCLDADALVLARLLVSRLLHDLNSPLGTLCGMLEMLDGGGKAEGEELLGVAREVGAELCGRLRLQAAAWGTGAEPMDGDALRKLLAAAPAAQRVGFEFEGALFAAPMPAALVPLVLNGALLAAEALPRRGKVQVSIQRDRFSFLPEGLGATWPPEVLASLAGAPAAALAAGSRRIVAPLLLAQARAAGFVASLLPGKGECPPALLLTRA